MKIGNNTLISWINKQKIYFLKKRFFTNFPEQNISSKKVEARQYPYTVLIAYSSFIFIYLTSYLI